MFATISQIATFAAAPSNLLPAVGLLGLIIALARRRSAGLWLASLGIGGTLIAGILPIANILIRPLEERFPRYQEDGRPIDGIIVLSGAVDLARSLDRGEFSLNGAAERVVSFMEMARRHPEARLIYTGGSAGGRSRSEAQLAAEQMKRLGLSTERLLIETASGTTWDNARNTKALLGDRAQGRWVLITSASHMPRAMGCFRTVGLTVIPYPVDYQTRGATDTIRPFTIVGQGLQRLDIAAKEWLGLFGYRISGRTSSFFPGPDPVGSPGAT
ncbi:YdcF family protein [Bosea sp. (in: a-proteobacteria)]|jgi:uncharacterized SAM-binding protein YcdF (DUF218 family)|uniref:YdcF family protein n=1 Tax=Bosea sp. (in: a-proteobacteria) TaxID=1871050 RepID=UPI003F706F69